MTDIYVIGLAIEMISSPHQTGFASLSWRGKASEERRSKKRKLFCNMDKQKKRKLARQMSDRRSGRQGVAGDRAFVKAVTGPWRNRRGQMLFQKVRQSLTFWRTKRTFSRRGRGRLVDLVKKVRAAAASPKYRATPSTSRIRAFGANTPTKCKIPTPPKYFRATPEKYFGVFAPKARIRRRAKA